MWIARDKDGRLNGFCAKPYRNEDEWMIDNLNGWYQLVVFNGETEQYEEEPGFEELTWEDEPKEMFLTSFDELVEKLCPPKHDGKTFGLETEMLIAKLKYKKDHSFNSYEEEKQWMIDYLKEHWNHKDGSLEN